MDENKKNRPGDQRSKTEREEAGSVWKASPGLSTPSTGAPGRGPPLYDYRTEEEERIAAATTGTSPEPLTATISEQTEGEFTLEGASVGAAPAVPKEGAVSGVFREMGPEGSSEVNVEEKTGIGREGRDKLAAAKRHGQPEGLRRQLQGGPDRAHPGRPAQGTGRGPPGRDPGTAAREGRRQGRGSGELSSPRARTTTCRRPPISSGRRTPTS